MLFAGLTAASHAILAQSEAPEWLSSAWYLLIVVFGFSVVVLFHEVGHFVAARWAGVRVERFAVGFGRELFGFTRGGTRFSFNVLPFGGYVKMLGQEDFAVDKSGELKVRHHPDSYAAKPVGKRMIIVSGGVIMNLVFAAIAFAVVTMIGRYVPPAMVGIVDPTSPAGRAGIQAGDRIVAVNDQPIHDFGDLMGAVVLSDINEELELTVLREGNIVEPRPRVLPEYRPHAKVRQIGLGPAMNRRVALAVSRALAGELQPNDLLVRIGAGPDAREIRHFSEVWLALVDARGMPVELIVQRPTGPVRTEDLFQVDSEIPSRQTVARAAAVWQLLPSEDADRGTCSLLGLVPRLYALEVYDGSAAELGGVRKFDVIVRAGYLDYPSLSEFADLVRLHENRDLPLVVRRPTDANGPLDETAVRFLSAHREALLSAARRDPAAALAELQSRAAQDGLSPASRDAVLADARNLTDAAAWRNWLERIDLRRLIVRPVRPRRLFGPAGPPALGLEPVPAEEDRLVVADVLDTLRGRPSPAARAGIPRGAVILSVDGRPVSRWVHLTDEFRRAAGRPVVLEYRVDDRIARTTLDVPHSISTLLNLPPDARITEIAGHASARIDSAADLSPTVALPDWRAAAAILRQNIGRTVSVRYQTRDEQTHEQPMTVTEEYVDPWLLRVAFGPSFVCYPLLDFQRELNPFRALLLGGRRAYVTTVQTYLSIKHIVFTREVSVEKVSGPVGILRQGSEIAEGGWVQLLWFLGLISANLAVINFLPLPIVDGGLFIFLLLEKIRGEPVSIKTQVVTQLIGIALIVTVFLLVTIQDIANWNR